MISCFIKIQNGLPFWCRLTQVVLEKRPLNECCYVMMMMIVMLISWGCVRGTESTLTWEEGHDDDEISTALTPRVHGTKIMTACSYAVLCFWLWLGDGKCSLPGVTNARFSLPVNTARIYGQCIPVTHIYSPYTWAHCLIPVHMGRMCGCQKMHPYVRAVNKARTYGP